MIQYNRLLCVLLCSIMAGVAVAQNGINSPYSRYGFGVLSDQSTSANKGMGGISYGLRNKHQVNAGNPASYSAVDSLTFLFDAGLTLQNTNFDNGSIKMNAKNAYVDYLAFQFRMFKHVGLTAGFPPYSRVNYGFTSSQEINDDLTHYNSYTGEGGLSQAFVGVGWEVMKNLSLGVNMAYLWGDLNHTVSSNYSSTSVWSDRRLYLSSINSYNATVGVQYSLQLKPKHMVTLGATCSLGHDIKADAYKIQQSLDDSGSSSVVNTEKSDTLRNAFELPYRYGVGLTYVYDKRFTIGVDYTLQQWAGTKYPRFNGNTTEARNEWQFQDTQRFALGMEYLPNPESRNLLKRMRYRLGGYYTDSYVSVKGVKSREYGVGGALVVPILNNNSTKQSVLTIAAEYTKVDPKTTNLIKENYLKLSVGLTFGDMWFFKWKVQ